MVAKNPWDRQEGESVIAFSYFAVFRDIPTAQRTFGQVAKLVDKGPNYISRLGVENKWNKRVEAWEDHCDQLRQKQSENTRLAHDAIAVVWSELTMKKMLESLEFIQPEKVGPQYMPRIMETAYKVSVSATGGRRKSGAAKEDDEPVSFEQEMAKLEKELKSKSKPKEELPHE